MPAEEPRQKQFTEDEFCGGKEAMSPLLDTDSMAQGACDSRQQVDVFGAQFEMANVDTLLEPADNWPSCKRSDLMETSQHHTYSDGGSHKQAESMDGENQKDMPYTEDLVSGNHKMDSEQGNINTEAHIVETNDMSALIPDTDACDIKTVESFVCDVMNNAITEWLSTESNDGTVTAVNQGTHVAVADHQIMNFMSQQECSVGMEIGDVSNKPKCDATRDTPEDGVASDTPESDAPSYTSEGDVASDTSEDDVASDTPKGDAASDNPPQPDAAASNVPDEVSASLMESAQIEPSYVEDESVTLRSYEFDAAFQTEAADYGMMGESYSRDPEAVKEMTITEIESSDNQVSAHISDKVISEPESMVEEERRSYEDDEVFASDGSSLRDHSRVFPTVYGIADGVPRDAGTEPTGNTFRASQLEDSHGLEGGDGPMAIGGAEGGQCEDSKDGDVQKAPCDPLGTTKSAVVDAPEYHLQSGFGDTVGQPPEDLQLMQSGSSCSDDQAFVYSEESDSTEASSSSDDNDDYRPHTSQGHYRPLTVRPDRLDVTDALNSNTEEMCLSGKDELAGRVHYLEEDDQCPTKDPLATLHPDAGNSPVMSHEDPYMTYVASGGPACTTEGKDEDKSNVNI